MKPGPLCSLFALSATFLVIATSLLATSPALGQLGPAPTRLETRESVVTALVYYKIGNGKKAGGTSQVRVTVGGAPAGDVRIGFFESEVGGSGNMWRSAGWAASTTAAQLTEFNPYATQVAFDVKGYVDGPSAGALMTIGVISALRGEPVRTDAAMTGTINPDGVIGPVGGIIYKIEGAAKAGKKLVVIPRGMQLEFDTNTETWVDLVEHGKKHGVEVKPVLDIYSAYALMTGKQLPRPKMYGHPVANTDSEALLKRRIVTWTERYQHALKTYVDLPEDSQSEVCNNWIAESKTLLERAQKLLSEGEVTAAYVDVAHANVYAYMSMEFGRCLFEYNRRGLAGAVKRVKQNGWLAEEMRDTSEQMQDFEPRTFDQLAMYLTASETYFEAICCQRMAQNALDNLPADNDELAAQQVLMASGWQIIAWLDLKIASNYLSLARSYQGTPIPENVPIREMADFYFKAYQANVNVLESLVIAEAAKGAGVPEGRIRYNLMQKDLSYAIMNTATRDIAPNLDRLYPNARKRGYPYLAVSLYLHLHGSSLVSKYYSLGAKLNADLEVVGMQHERLFNDWLEWSEAESRRNIGLLDDHGISTTTFAHIYEVAHVSRNRDLDARLRALTWFYNANVNAQVIRHLAGISLVADDKLAPPANE